MTKKTVILTRGKTDWLLGGQWTAGGRFPKRPRNLKALAIEEGFDPAHTAAVWLADEQQIGWYAFAGAPKRGKPLAALAARKIGHDRWPWQGLFCLDADLWWLVVTDSTGAVHPLWDIVGTHDELMQVMTDRIAELATIQHQDRFETVEESWNWLLSDEDLARQIPLAVPVTAAQQSAKRAAMILLPALVVIAGGAAGLAWWKKHQMLKAQMAAQQAAAAQAALQNSQKAQEAAREAAMIAQIQQQWAATPRPWAQMHTWSDVIAACQPGPLTQDGWHLTGMQCHVQGDNLKIDRLWSRGQFATVLQAPQGTPDAQGQNIVQTSTVPLPPAAPGSAAANAQQAALWWLGMTQQWAGVLQIKADPLTPYRPPFPPNTPPAVQQKLQPPVLWQSGKVTITSQIAPGSKPPALWPVLSAAGFVPESMQISLQGQHLQWTLEGTQYANP